MNLTDRLRIAGLHIQRGFVNMSCATEGMAYTSMPYERWDKFRTENIKGQE